MLSDDKWFRCQTTNYWRESQCISEVLGLSLEKVVSFLPTYSERWNRIWENSGNCFIRNSVTILIRIVLFMLNYKNGRPGLWSCKLSESTVYSRGWRHTPWRRHWETLVKFYEQQYVLNVENILHGVPFLPYSALNRFLLYPIIKLFFNYYYYQI